MYGIDDRLKIAAGALVLLLAGYFFLTPQEGSDQQVHSLQIERDVYIIDPTSTTNTWHEIQAAMLQKLRSPFGQYIIDGEVIGSQLETSMADISVVAIGRNSEDLRMVDVLTSEDVTLVWETAMGDSNTVRAQKIYDQVLAPQSVVWSGLASEYFPVNLDLENVEVPDSEACTSIANELMSETAVSDYVDNVKTLSVKVCHLIRTGLQGMVDSEQLMIETDKDCRANGNKECSDILGAIKIATEAVDDAAKSDEDLQRSFTRDSAVSYEYSACLVFGSDMIIMNHETNMERELLQWSIEDAEAEGEIASQNHIPGGFQELSGHIYVGYSKLGVKDKNPLRDFQKTNLKSFWQSFFETANAEIARGSTATTCE